MIPDFADPFSLIDRLGWQMVKRFPPARPTELVAEVIRLHYISSRMGVKQQWSTALALYNLGNVDGGGSEFATLWSSLHTCVEQQTRGVFEPPRVLCYLVNAVMLASLIAPANEELPPPTPPAPTSGHGKEGLSSSGKDLSTQYTRLKTFAYCFQLEGDAWSMLPELNKLERRQCLDERTVQSTSDWEKMWNGVRTGAGIA